MSTLQRALAVARDLNDAHDLVNHEYVRGQAELICDLFGFSMDGDKDRIMDYICHDSDHVPVPDLPAVGTGLVAAQAFPASIPVAEWVLAVGRSKGAVFEPDSEGEWTIQQWDGDGTSEWRWIRLNNGDLILGFYPESDVYMAIEGVVADDYERALVARTLTTFRVEPDVMQP